MASKKTEIFLAFPETILSFFVKEAATIEIGSAYLRIVGFSQLFALCLACANMKRLYVQMEKSVHAETYQKMAYSDALTGLENRMALEKRQKQMPDRVTYVLFDLNDLKGINDHYGHSAGDTAIIAAAESIREAFQGLC